MGQDGKELKGMVKDVFGRRGLPISRIMFYHKRNTIRLTVSSMPEKLNEQQQWAIQDIANRLAPYKILINGIEAKPDQDFMTWVQIGQHQ
jgi:hypothetical protein